MIRWRQGRPIVEVWDPAKGEKVHVKPKDFGMDFRALKCSCGGQFHEKPRTRCELDQAARELEQTAEEAVLTGGRKRPDEETVAEFAARWSRDYPRNRGESTILLNEQRLKFFVRDFGDRPLGDVDRREAREWANQHPDRVPAVRAMFNDAMTDRIVDFNPFAMLGMKQSKGRKNIVVLTREEIDLLADTAFRVHGEKYGPEMRALVLWAAFTCMRPGEIFAARWSKLDGSRYRLEEQYHSKLRQTVAPKHGSVGTVFVPDEARDAVLAMPRRLGDDLMFRTSTGKQITAPTFSHIWKPVRTAFYALLEPDHPLLKRQTANPKDVLTLHELRHFGASFMLNVLGLEPWVIAKQLRHADESLITSLYGHPDEDEALRRIEAAWDRAAGKNVRSLRRDEEAM